MQSFYSILNSHDLLAVSGEDSEKFLQGQLTCDLEKLAQNHCQLGAACTNKGRVYSSFRLLRLDAGFILAMQPGMTGITQPALQKYIPFYKAAMADCRADYYRLGLAGPEAEQLLASHYPDLPAPDQLTRHGDHLLLNLSGDLPRYEVWTRPGSEGEILGIISQIEEQSPAVWQALDQNAGLCMLQPGDSEQYTPEELDMDLAGFISFNKGCYTGQEIVARMHFRGKAKKRLFHIRAEADLEKGENILFDSSGNTLGSIFNILIFNNNISCFSVLVASTAPGTGYLEDSGKRRIPVSITPCHPAAFAS